MANRFQAKSNVKTSLPTQLYIPSAELAEVHRDVFNFLAHEVGGIASTLGLRVDALGEALPASDQLAFRGLADQIRDLYRMIRLLEGPRGGSLLAPSRLMPVADWWRLTSHLLNTELPRGMTIVASPGTVRLKAEQAHLLTTLLLLACRDVRDRDIKGPTSLHARLTPMATANPGVVVELEIPRTVWPESSAPRLIGRWQRYAARVAKKSNTELMWWSVDTSIVMFRCVVP